MVVVDVSHFSSLAGHHGEELLVVDLAVAINIDVRDDLIDFVVVELFAQIAEHMAEFVRWNETVAILEKEKKTSFKRVFYWIPYEMILYRTWWYMT